MRFRLAALVAVFSVLAIVIAACGGNNGGSKTSATDAASGLTVTVQNDQVSLKRTAKSTAGTAGTSGTVSCTDDYAKLVKATAVPAPSQPWYATTLITWPSGGKETTATLSHSLKSAPQLCVVQSADQSASAIVYFNAQAKAGVQKLQSDSAKQQQATQAPAALQSAAQAAVGTVSKGAFPAPAAILPAITSQGLYAKSVASMADATDTGTIYIVTDKTTNKTLTMVVKDSKGVVNVATQGVKGSPKLTTVKK
ncbi:MAG TPA: hypothetical protein VI318_09980 [Baekduia sp.]